MTKRATTIQDVAREARVSRTTVSRVLNRDETVHPVIRENVTQVMQRLNYRPSPIARSLKSRRSRLIATVFSELAYPAVWSYLEPFERELRTRGYTSIMVNSGGALDVEAAILRDVDELRVDGILWYPVALPESLDTAPDLRASVVVVADRGGPYSSVSIDIESLSRTAVDTLVRLGHRRIGFIRQRRAPGESGLSTLLRRDMELAGGELDPTWDRWFPDTDACLAGISELLATSAPPPTALVVRASFVQPTYLALARAGLRVPIDVSVISVGDAEFGRFAVPPVDALTWRIDERAALTVDLLARTIEGTVPEPVQIVQQVEYRPRESTAQPRPQ